MDSIFGIGLPELILIMIIAGMVMGPQRIAVAARWLGRTTSQLQSISRTFFRQLNAELSAADSDGQLRETYNELQSLRSQIEELRQEVTSVARNTVDEGREAVQSTRKEAENMIAPPSLQKKDVSASVSVRPPSLTEVPASNGHATKGNSPKPPDLPSRIDVADDPE